MIAPAEEAPELSKYEILEEIGHGGMARVYRARDRRLGREVAVKVIHRHLRESPEVAARFASEARAVAKLEHPSIVKVYDVSDADEADHWLVVELVRGTTLRKLLHSRGRLPAEIAAAIGIELASALAHAHGAGVVHRDVKPENVLVELPTGVRIGGEERAASPGGSRVKITDFGIAKLLDAQGVTSTGQVLGSPAHMAPEQIEGGEVDARSDVFGLGVLLYECLVGKLPFDGKNPAQVLRRVLDGAFVPPERAEPTVGATLGAIVSRALAHDPAERWPDATSLANALRAALAAVEVLDPASELAAWLEQPEEYRRQHEENLVARLVGLGVRARAARDVTAAAAHFNRALAYRPADPELIRLVAGLARQARLRRHLRRGGAVLGAAVAVAGASYAVARSVLTPRLGDVEAEAARVPRVDRVLPAVAPVPVPLGRPTQSAPPERQEGPPSLRAAPPAGEPRSRKVRIAVGGAKGGQVLVDGAPFAEWFTSAIELPVGTHRFEAVPPSETCCEAKGPQIISVPPGDGVFNVQLALPFRAATVGYAVPPGGTARCPLLFSQVLSGSGEVTVPMARGRVSATCTLSRDGQPDQTRALTVIAGERAPLSW
ncbi:MAG: serine/threonine protein kinase [Polyangiaceae bacterium]|nr:serine/threonine protein kinase [Polyangiaceae bacterium]